jgi:hypothetical protein
MKTIGMTAIKQIHRANWKRADFFGVDEMKFFRSEVGNGGYVSATGLIYFATSEQGPHMPRRGTVRVMDPESGGIDTVGRFGEHNDIGAADRAAEQAARGMCENA